VCVCLPLLFLDHPILASAWTVVVMCEAGDEDTFLLFSCRKGEQIKRMLMGK